MQSLEDNIDLLGVLLCAGLGMPRWDEKEQQCLCDREQQQKDYLQEEMQTASETPIHATI